MPAARKPPIEVRESPIHGSGAFAARRIRKGSRVAEYTGERISNADADARYDDDKRPLHHTFLFAIDDDVVIDATRDGNESRFINHSCEPNCESYIHAKRVFIAALRDIEPGEELFYDYSLERDEPYRRSWAKLYACRCGAPTCRGTMLKDAPPPARKRQPRR